MKVCILLFRVLDCVKKLNFLKTDDNKNKKQENSDASETILHEEDSHGINTILGIEKSPAEEHTKYFNHPEGNESPSNDQVRTDPTYENSKAKENLDETDQNVKDEKY